MRILKFGFFFILMLKAKLSLRGGENQKMLINQDHLMNISHTLPLYPLSSINDDKNERLDAAENRGVGFCPEKSSPLFPSLLISFTFHWSIHETPMKFLL